MSSESRHLIVLCGNFPYGFAEPFLDVELHYLQQHFPRITICNTSRSSDANQPEFEVPNGIELINLDVELSLFDKLTLPIRIASKKEIGEEINVIRNAYHSSITWGKLKTMFVSWLRAEQIAQLLEESVSISTANTYIYSYWADDAALASVFLKKRHPTLTTFCRVHGWDLYFERSLFYYLPFRKLIYNGLDAVFPISENGKNYLLSHFDTIIDKGRIYQSRLGIRTVNSLSNQTREFRRFRLVSCSNLIPIKRVELIVRALAEINELEIDWTHFGDGTEMQQLKELSIQLLGEKENVAFHFQGRLPNWQVLEFYSNHTIDLFITLSKYDGIPVSIMEAMSFGIPALATDVGGVSEIVINGKTGFLLDQEIDPEDVAEVIENVASMDQNEYNAMRKEAKNIWGEFYSADVNYPAFCEKVLNLNK